MNKKDLIAIRDFQEADKDFIFATWLRGLRYGNSWFELIDSVIYYKVYHDAIDFILNNPKITIKVACLKDDPEVILGYTVYKGPRLDWVFVKKAWRKIGIAKSLIPKDISSVTHITNVGLSILKKHKNVRFNPFDIN